MTQPAPRWRHYCCAPGPVVPGPRKQDYDFKPVGLWLSDDNANRTWSQYCATTGQVNLGTFVHDVTLSGEPLGSTHEDAKLLRLADAKQLGTFTRRFRRDPAALLGNSRASHVRCLGGMFIDWPAVARRYDGILITPYVRECRNDRGMQWYYAWDCASGCIWHPRAIKTIIEYKRWVQHYAPDDPRGDSRYIFE